MLVMDGFDNIYRSGANVEAWELGHLRTLKEHDETMAYALLHPYDDALVFALQQQLIADWMKTLGVTGGTIGPAVTDAQFKRAVMVLDDLRLAGYEIMIRKKKPEANG